MGDAAMRRAHFVRMLTEEVNVEGVENDRVVNITSKELESESVLIETAE